METKLKEFYDAPQVSVFEVKAEGVICASVTPSNPFGGNEEHDW